MKTNEDVFDQYNNEDVTAFHLENDNGVRATVLSQGGIIRELSVPTDKGQQNLLLEYPTTADYYSNPFYVNMMIGPVAGRIKDAKFEVNGKITTLKPNENGNELHSGAHGFHSVQWEGYTETADGKATLTLHHRFEDQEGGFPGMNVNVIYTLTNANTFTVHFEAETSAPTTFNPTYHTYFNLNGAANILDHDLQVNGTRHLAVDPEKIPTGDFIDNANTPFDFAQTTRLGDAIDGMQNTAEKGFDDIYEVVPTGDDHAVVTVSDPASNRAVTLLSKRNGLIVFTANSFTNDMNLTVGQGKPYMGVALEAQNLSDATRFENFGDVTLFPGETKSYEIGYHVKF